MQDELVSWRDLGPERKSIGTWSSGTTATTKASARRIFAQSGRTGKLFRDGFPGGESFEEIGARADRVVGRLRSTEGAVLLFSSGHFLRVLAARWLGLKPQDARYLLLSTASLSTLTYEHNPSEPVIGMWNDTHHVSQQCLEEAK